MKRLPCEVGALALFAACQGPAGAGAKGPEEQDHPLLGAHAPAFELPAATGSGTVSLTTHSGKAVIVDFWATWCEPCRESFPLYQKLVDQHAGRLVVIGVSVDEERQGIEEFAAATGVRFPLAWDEGQRVSAQYSPPAMPTSYFVDPSGIVRFVHTSFRTGDEAAIAEHVEALLR
jgi:peroxiredoxin